MSLLREIQQALMTEGSDIGPILLKLRFLSSRLGSDPLEEWVKHEAEGYPPGVEVPEYRKIGISFTADFSGPFGSGIRNAPIPPYLVEKFAGKRWTEYEVRQSVAAIDQLVGSEKNAGGSLQIVASDLMLLLQGNVYPNYACNSVRGNISAASLTELQYSVRSRVLDLTIKLEKSVPYAAEIALTHATRDLSEGEIRQVTNITNQTIFGNYTGATSTGDATTFRVDVQTSDLTSFIKALTDNGIPQGDAKQLAAIVECEKPESPEKPFGTRAKEWLGNNLGKAASGAWKIGMEVAPRVLTEAALKYYGLK